MSDLLAARSQMAVSLMFHILFAIAGMAMPALMVVSEAWWRRTGDPVYLDLTRRWARGTAILFAVGAVSGTVLSFELGLLWPRFMEHAGAVIGMPFSLEGFAGHELEGDVDGDDVGPVRGGHRVETANHRPRVAIGEQRQRPGDLDGAAR